MRKGTAKLVVAATLAIALTVPAAAQGVVTIGSNLSSAPNVVLAGGPWTVFQDPLGAQFQAPGGLVSPVDGTVTQWRLRVGSSATPTAFRVIRPLAGGLYTGAGTSLTVTPTLNSVNTFSTQLPIKVGDRIGINCCSSPGANYFTMNPTGIRKEIQPLLVDGGPGQSNVQTDNREILLNADIEPTATLGSVKAKSKKGGKLKVTMVAPNPGKLSATGKGLHSTTTQVPAAGPLTLVVKPYQVAKRKIAKGRTVKTKLKLTFTPTGGSAAAQTLKVKLKP